MLNSRLNQKIDNVHAILNNKKVLVAFSGGVDSSVVTSLAQDVCDKILAVTADSKTFTKEELENAKEVALELGVKWKKINFDELSNNKFVQNPPNRCYYCKKELMIRLKTIQNRENLNCIIDGTNADDIGDHRPGLLALQELKIRSPLAEAGITKKEVREIAKNRKLSVWQRPSMACLSSRFPYGEKITEEKLLMVERAEKFIKKTYAIKVVRVRHYGKMARIEVGRDEMENLLSINILNDINNYLINLGFIYVTLDLQNYRTGSMNELL
ncbi:MAG: ATP-dependent sacrificial sulfur transferase LarE [Candidatus Helarchaeota archaeon]